MKNLFYCIKSGSEKYLIALCQVLMWQKTSHVWEHLILFFHKLPFWEKGIPTDLITDLGDQFAFFIWFHSSI
jgi:hypothetical protein